MQMIVCRNIYIEACIIYFLRYTPLILTNYFSFCNVQFHTFLYYIIYSKLKTFSYSMLIDQ